MTKQLAPIEQAIAALASGNMIILVDDESRENEGDLVIAAEFATPQAINFMITHARGLACLAMEEADFERLNIPMMVRHNRAPRQTAFGVSIEAREGVTTGISAFDRSHTIQTAINETMTGDDIVMPGHVFPLCAKPGGVLARNGHTEGGVDLSRLAGLKPAAVICEIMNEDGTMARLPDLHRFAENHGLLIASIHDLQTYRIKHEQLMQLAAQANLPIEGLGQFSIEIYKSTLDEQETVVISKPTSVSSPLVRLHSACFTGDILGSARCDCGAQLKVALEQIQQAGGYIIYLPQEGRGIGLTNKIKAYALQEEGLDTVEANQRLGFAADLRDYGQAAQILLSKGISSIQLMTNNPRKIEDLQRYGVTVDQRVTLQTPVSADCIRYLQTKRDKLGHWVSVDNINNN